MALEFDSQAKIMKNRDHLTLEDLREFVEATKEWGGATKVLVKAPPKGSYVQMTARYGDVIR